jgi:hypothetical protein
MGAPTPLVEHTSRSDRWQAAWDRFLHRPWLAAATLAIASLAICATISLARWPQPSTHDEFAYLLNADTFCHGRLTNPTHPEWQHFESIHVIQQPSYASKYPPGQGALLALGQWLTGWPLAGVWLESALAAAAIYWMLLGWTSPRWAFLGGVLWITQPKLQLAWNQSYWGGTLAFACGALVFGAALRMTRRTAVLDAAAMAVGAVGLAATRPFEGMLFCVFVGAWLGLHWARHGLPPLPGLALNTALPNILLVCFGVAALANYNKAVTGDPLTMPYIVHERAYAQCPMFVGQSPLHPSYRHQEIERFHGGWAMDWYRMQSTLSGLLRTKFEVTKINLKFFFPPTLAIGILLVRPWRWRRVTPALVVAGLAYAASLPSIWNHPHYSAAIVPPLMLAAVAGLRRADVLGRRIQPWMRVGTALVAVQIVVFVAAAWIQTSNPMRGWADARATIAQQLRDLPGNDLVLVRYSPQHSTLQEWVYNDADIDAAPVVWARAMDPASDAELLRYFNNRHVWLLEPDDQRLVPLPANYAHDWR